MNFGAWSFGVGDPTWMGWFILLLYFVSAALCYLASSNKGWTDALVWRCASMLMITLGINKQLDFQTLLTEIGRVVLGGLGILEHRLIFQYGFVCALVLAIIGFLFAAKKVSGLSFNRFKFLLFGLMSVLTFYAFRAASFHHVDQLLGVPFLGVTFNFMIGASAIRAKSPHEKPVTNAFFKVKQMEREMYINKHRYKDCASSKRPQEKNRP
jgi:hypothetical protein